MKMKRYLLTLIVFLSMSNVLQTNELESRSTTWVIQDQNVKISATDIMDYIKQVKQGSQPFGHAGLQHHVEHYYIREHLVKKAEETQLSQSDKYQQALKEFQKNYLASEALNVMTEQQVPDFSAQAKEIYLAKMNGDYQLPLRLRVNMIRLNDPEKLKSIRDQIENKDLDFTTAVKKYSDDPLKTISKGDSYWFSKGQKPDVVYQHALVLSEDNRLSPVFNHRGVWYLLAFKGRKEAGVRDFVEVKSEITGQLKKSWRKDFQKEKLDELKQRFTHVKVDMAKIKAAGL